MKNPHLSWKKIQSKITRKKVLVTGGVLSLFLLATPIATYAYYAHDISDRQRLMNHSDTGIILRDSKGEIFYQFGKINGNDETSLEEVSDKFEQALLASEDADFYNHEGISLKGIAGALFANVLNKNATRYGGSTITQQLVKNKLLSTEKSFLRKYQEVSLAIAIDRQYTKDEILEMYINSIYFGEGAFGISDAAKAYFNKSPKDLTLAESTMLVGLLPAPSIYSPLSGDPKLAKIEQERVLNRLVETKKITPSIKNQTYKEGIKYQKTLLAREEHAQHFALMVIEKLKKDYGEEAVLRSGYDVTTSLNLDWQKAAENNIRESVANYASLGARNAGLLAINPKNGHIMAMVGSVDWKDPTFGKVNMTLQQRQPGSSFKPIYFTEALDQRLITAATIVEDEPKTYGGTFKPTNYDLKYRGDVTVRSALAQSLNIPAVEVMQKLGVVESTQAASRVGITTVTDPDKYGLSLALGTAEVNLYEMVNAYAAYANGGEQYKPVLVIAIKDKFDNNVFTAEKMEPARVMSAEASYLISSILSDNEARAPIFRNGLTILNRKVAVKTGTTNDSRDAWTIGYTPSIAIGVWMGNNENQPMQGLAGSSSAGVVWKKTMTSILTTIPAEDFIRPANIIGLRICSSNGLRATGSNTQGVKEELFIKGTEPAQECNKPAATQKQEEKKDEKKEDIEIKQPEKEPAPVSDPENEPGSTTDPSTPEEGGRGAGAVEPTPEPEPTTT